MAILIAAQQQACVKNVNKKYDKPKLRKPRNITKYKLSNVFDEFVDVHKATDDAICHDPKTDPSIEC